MDGTHKSLQELKDAGMVIKQNNRHTITENEVLAAQRAWADGVVAVGKAYMEGGDYKALATAAASQLYAYDYDPVLFKPTRCVDKQFRPTPLDALSYFIGEAAGDCHISEDGGFAIQPWSDVRFNNHAINVQGNTGIAMGNYFFTDAKTGQVSKVEYTFGYRKFGLRGNNVRIFLHHSSVPYKKPTAAPAASSGAKDVHIDLRKLGLINKNNATASTEWTTPAIVSTATSATALAACAYLYSIIPH